MRMRIFLCAFYSSEAELRTEDCTPTLGYTNYTQVLDEGFQNVFNDILK